MPVYIKTGETQISSVAVLFPGFVLCSRRCFYWGELEEGYMEILFLTTSCGA